MTTEADTRIGLRTAARVLRMLAIELEKETLDPQRIEASVAVLEGQTSVLRDWLSVLRREETPRPDDREGDLNRSIGGLAEGELQRDDLIEEV